MSDKLTQIEEKLKRVENSFYQMGTKRERALSTHETEDLCDEMQLVTQDCLQLIQQIKAGQ